eukprot:NODE_169_length_14535_cov_0.769881.p9 type:complete len:118 gc:universal NODE_169_length_14535_cov_0.769881:7118-6765(-)
MNHKVCLERKNMLLNLLQELRKTSTLMATLNPLVEKFLQLKKEKEPKCSKVEKLIAHHLRRMGMSHFEDFVNLLEQISLVVKWHFLRLYCKVKTRTGLLLKDMRLKRILVCKLRQVK